MANCPGKWQQLVFIKGILTKPIDTALADPNTLWSFCPNIGAAYLFTILFGVTTVTHLTQAIIYRKRYCWVICCSGLAQTICYIFRVLSIQHPTSFSDYAAWFILILVSRSMIK